MNIGIIEKHRKIFFVGVQIYNHLNPFNKLRIRKTNTLDTGIVLLKKVKIDIKGNGNQIIIKDFSRLNNCHIYIHGDNNKIIIGKKCSLNCTEFWIEDSNNMIYLGEHTSISGKTHLAAIEGTNILIGEDCMFSSDIHFRTGDSHSIVDLENNRTNPSQNIKIGNHVWVGTKVTCLKNTEIADNCIIAATSTLRGKHLKTNCIIGGVPAKVLKENVNWLRERI